MLTYFLQVNLCWLMFYGLYYALLSRETFFKLNRIYLIISLLCGLVIPLSSAYFSVKDNSPAVIMLEPFVVSANLLREQLAQAETWSVWGILKVLYGIGGAVLGFHFIVGLFRIWAIYRKGEKTNLSEFILVNTEGVFNPFSFFKWVFFNNNAIQKDDFQQIILHEKAHVTQKHSYDVVFLELLKIAFWWSPLIYFYKKSLVNVHEYLADEAVLQTTTPPQYGRLLLRQMQSGVQPAFANNFFSQFKKRILMMTRNPSQRTALLRYTIAVPMFLLLVSFFSMPNNPVMAKTEDLSAKVETSIKVLDESIKANLNEKPLKIVENKTPASPIVNTIYDNQPLTVQLDGGYKNGIISLEEFKKQKSIVAFEVVKGVKIFWKVESFVALHIPPKDGSDIIQVTNKSDKFSSDMFKIQDYAKEGDSYQFQNIKIFDEKRNRVVFQGSMNFRIKSKESEKKIEKIIETANDVQTIYEKEMNASYDIAPAAKDLTPINSTIPKDKISSTQFLFPKDTSPVYTIVDEHPEYKGGGMKMFEWLGQNTKYPTIARENGFQGTVYVGFVIEKDGSLSNVTIKRGVKNIVRDTITIIETGSAKGNKIIEREDHSIDNEAKRVVSMMPKWKPGRKKGEIVRVAYILPIKFKLE